MASRARGVAVAAATVAAVFVVPPAASAAAPEPVMQVNIRDGVRRAGQPAGLVGHLLRGPNDPVAGEPVTLWSSPDQITWTQRASGTTDALGGAAFTVTPSETTWYSIRHPETANAGAAQGGARLAVTSDKAPPKPPERVAADRGDASVRVSWLPPPDDGGSAVTSYTVKAQGPDGTHTVTRSAATRTATVTGLTNGYSYRVSVTATTALGSATTTRDEYVVPRAGTPAPPSGGTHACGRLPLGPTTWNAAGSPYVVCPAGIVVPVGATLRVDGAEVRFRGLSSPGFGEPYGLDVRGGTLHVTGSTLRGEAGRPGEWRGVLTDETGEDWSWPYGSTGTAVRIDGSTVRHAVDAVRLAAPAAVTAFTDTVLADSSGAGLKSSSALRATRVTVRDVKGNGVAVECGRGTFWYDIAYVECPVVLTDLTVRRAGKRGLSVDTPDAVSVHGTVVTESGTAAPRSEAARFTGMTASVGGDLGDVTGGGNGIDAVVLDLTATNDVTWRTPVARSAASPGPLGYLVRSLLMAPGRGITFPAGSVVKGMPAPYDCSVTWYEPERRACVGGIDVNDGTLDASAPGTVFTGAADANAGISTCPSALAPACGVTGSWWSGLTVRGNEGRVTLAGATVRRAALGLYLAQMQQPGVAATVTGTAFERNDAALVAHHGGGPGGSLLLADTTVTDSPRGIEVTGIQNVDVAGVTVRRSGGVRLSAGHAWGGCGFQRPAVTVNGLTVEDAPGPGLRVDDLCHPSLRAVVVRRSGLPRGTEAIGKPAVTIDGTATYGPGKDVDLLAGGGNGIDAIAVSGWTQDGLTWRSPSNAAGDHDLGYVLGGVLTVTGSGTVTIPANALVAGLDESALAVRGPALDASAGGARFVSVRDAPLGCRSGCGPRRWGTVVTGGPLQSPQGDAHVAGATFRGATLQLVRDAYGSGATTVTGTTSDSEVWVRDAGRATVTDSTFAAIRVTNSTEVVVERNTVPAGGIVQVSNSSAPLVLRDNHVGAGGKGPAYLLGNVRATFGEAGTVSGNTGSGDNAVIALAGVEVDADLDWVTPTDELAPHPVGYVVAAHQASQVPARGLTVRAPHTLRVPAGAVVKGDQITVEGALDATAGGAVFTGLDDDTVGVRACYWTEVYAHPCQDPATAQYPSRLLLRGGALGIRAARLSAWVQAGTVEAEPVTRVAPGETGFGVAIRDSYVDGSLSTSGPPVAVTGTSFRRGGVSVMYGSGHVVRDVSVSGATGPGLRFANAPVDMREVEVTGSTVVPLYPDRGAVMVAGESAGSSFACLDVRGNESGFAAFDKPVTVTDSALDANAPGYDLDNAVAVTTTGVWWGQPGGPLPGQVRAPAQHTDIAPAGAPPACARADTKAPPLAPRSVAAVPGDHAVVAVWSPPLSDGGSPITGYVVVAMPGGASVVAGPDARSAKVPGLIPGQAYSVTVSARTAVGPSAASRASAPVRAAAGPTLAVSAPGVVTYGTDAVVTGHLTSAGSDVGGRPVHLYLRRNGTTAWSAPIALTTSATGTVTHRLRLRRSVQVRLTWAGDATLSAAASAVRTIALRPVISATLSSASVRYGSAATLSGQVAPGFAGRRVRLERRTASGWQDVTYVTLSSTSTYRFTLRPARRGSYTYRVSLIGTWENARAESPARTLTVT